MDYNHTCVQCTNQFFRYSKHYRINRRPKFCSQKCRYIISKKQQSICLNCNKEFFFFPSMRPGTFCDKKCEIIYRKNPQTRLETSKNYFFSHVIKNKNKCWEWTGPLRKGYGAMAYFRRSIGAHKFSWLISNGNIPEGLFVLHKCDTPTCTNPSHLWLGTPKENMEDMIQKKRDKKLKGTEIKNSKLTEDKVQEIKRMLREEKTPQEIVNHFNISLSSIYDIKDGRTWKHVTLD